MAAKIETVMKTMLFAMIAAMLLLTVIMPVIQSTTVSYTYGDNEPTYKMAQYDMTYNLRIDYTSYTAETTTSVYTLTVGEETSTLTLTADDPIQVYVWDNGVVMLSNSYFYATLANVSGILWSLSTGDHVTWNGAGSVVAAKGESTRTSAYTFVIAPTDDADKNATLGWYATGTSFNISKGGTMYVVAHGGSGRDIVGIGTIDAMRTLVGTATYDYSVTLDETEPSTYYDAVSGVTITYNDTSYNYRGSIADLEYTNGTANASGMAQMLLNILPIVLLVVLIMAVVGLVTSRND